MTTTTDATHIERLDLSAVIVIHPACLSAIQIHSLRAPAGTHYLQIDGLCFTCQRYVSLRVDGAITRTAGRPKYAKLVVPHRPLRAQ